MPNLPDYLKKLLIDPVKNKEKITKYLINKKLSNRYFIFNAIISADANETKGILLSLETQPDIFREAVMQKNIIGNSILHETLYLNKVEVNKEILSFLTQYPDILQEVLLQKNIIGNSVIIQAIDYGNVEIVENILLTIDKKTQDIILEEPDLSGDKALIFAIKAIVTNNASSKNHEDILKLIIKNKFDINIDKSKVLALSIFYKNHALLALMSNKSYGLGNIINPNILVKILNEVIASSKSESLQDNLISQIYCHDIVKVDSNQPILTHDNQCLYLYSSKLLQHCSFIIFNVDLETKNLKSISYCDGNFYDDLKDVRPDSNSTMSPRLYGVREFELEDKYEFSEDFAKKFINENFKEKNIYSLQLPFKFKSQTLKIKTRYESIDTKEQLRDNCSFKSANILARYLLQKISGEDYSKDYQDFKRELRKQVIEGLDDDYKKIKEQFGEKFLEFLGIKLRLNEIVGQKFGEKEKGLIENVLSRIEANDQDKTGFVEHGITNPPLTHLVPKTCTVMKDSRAKSV